MTNRPAQHARPGLNIVLAGLCATELVSWGLLYYAFPVLSPSISADTGWSSIQISAGFSAGLITSALLGVAVGKYIDRRGPRLPMTLGSILAGVALVVIAMAPHPSVFIGGWVLAGAAMAGTLYPPAFAALARWFNGRQQLQAFATLTLVAGLASTVFAPLIAHLNTSLGWRETYLWAAVVLVAVTMPLHWVLLRRIWPAEHQSTGEGHTSSKSYARQVTSSAQFRLLTVGLATVSLAMSAALIGIVPLMLERGLSPTEAAWVLGIGGVGQVAGRIVYAGAASRMSLIARTVSVFVLVAAGLAALAFISGPALLLIAFSIVAGVGRGIATLLQATAIPDRWGSRAYGHLSGVLGVSTLLAMAMGPWLGALLAEATGSYASAFIAFAALAGSGTVLMILSTRTARAPSH